MGKLNAFSRGGNPATITLGKKRYMRISKSEKLNIVHCEIQELINNCPVDLRLILSLVEEVRDDLMEEEDAL